MRPFKQVTISEGVFAREFSGDVDPEELVWHRDQEDRLITVTESAGTSQHWCENGYPDLCDC